MRTAYDKNIAEIRDAIRSVWQYSVALPPEEVSGDARPVWKVALVDRPKVTFDIDDVFPPPSAHMQIVDAFRLRVFLDENRLRLRKAIHLRLGDGQGGVAYFISDEALRAMPTDFIVEQLIPDIMQQLVAKLKEHRRAA